MFPFDLHVLGLPPAFNLSHDQTLQLNIEIFTNKLSVDTLNECPHRLSCYKLLKSVPILLAAWGDAMPSQAGCEYYVIRVFCQEISIKNLHFYSDSLLILWNCSLNKPSPLKSVLYFLKTCRNIHFALPSRFKARILHFASAASSITVSIFAIISTLAKIQAIHAKSSI